MLVIAELATVESGPKQDSTVWQVSEDQRTVARVTGLGKAGKLARHITAARTRFAYVLPPPNSDRN